MSFSLTVLNSDANKVAQYLEDLNANFMLVNSSLLTITLIGYIPYNLMHSFKISIDSYDLHKLDPYLIYHLASSHEVILTEDLKLEGRDIFNQHSFNDINWEEQEQRRALFQLNQLTKFKE